MWPVCLQAVKMVDSQCWFRIRPSALPMLPAAKARPAVLHLPAVWKPRTGYLTIRCSVCQPPPVPLIGGGVGEESVEILERFFRGPSSADTGPVMTGKHGAFGAVTLEKGKLNMPQKQSKSSPELAIGGGGGDIGKKIKHGGGGGGDDDGDDDNYFDDFDDGDEGDEGGLFRRRILLKEFFELKFIEAVLSEWHKTVTDLPAGFRQACEMGLVSSAQMVKFLAINARPTTARFISRSLPDAMSRAFIGRMIADPAFLYKLLLDQAATLGFSVSWELKNRRDRIKEEWDLALVNVLTASLSNALVVCALAPCRSYGNTFRFNLENTLQKLPNNVFERSYPLREFNLRKRIHSSCYKAAELCLVGLTAGALQGSLSKFLAGKRERLSVTIPSVSSNALGYGSFLGICANLSYQLLCGADMVVADRFDVIGVSLAFGTVLRVMNINFSETARHAWLGSEADLPVHSGDLLKAYNRPSICSDPTPSKPSFKWSILKNTIISGFGLLGTRQGCTESTNGKGAAPAKTRRKRRVRKKMVAG
ncbi:hypothetical protein SAY86_020949 [Trapa natans]|uniref:Protein RETICULATA-RELATED 1, chloroplastic n=1 Tax=Trapa natans TaxID=22666 RepID=A0AAN7REF4_TRANT|nr:hypothetical protein SAY86_020949 [Trapa natans]